MKEIKEITGMRGLAAQAVVFFHFCAISTVLQTVVLSSVGIPLAWNSGVDFFFVLSGFLLAIPFMQMKKIELKSYYLKRSLRILPAYYVSFVFILLFFSKHPTTSDIIASIFFAQNFFRPTFTSINGVYWTLTIEEIFYATLPLFAILFVKRRWIFALPACIIFSSAYREIVYSLYHNNLGPLNFYLWQYPSYVEHYAIGVTLAALFVEGKFAAGKLKSSRPMIGVIIVLVVTEYFIGIKYQVQAYDLPLANLLFALEYAGLIYFTLASPLTNKLRWIFTNKFTIITGRLSYSTYVWHLPIEVTFYSFGLPLIQWMLFSYLAIMAIASLSYHLVEKPFLSLKDRIAITSQKPLGKRLDLRKDLPVTQDLKMKEK
jgi:peptidoglycan/LPS O-acetylase OafA/YrhL